MDNHDDSDAEGSVESEVHDNIRAISDDEDDDSRISGNSHPEQPLPPNIDPEYLARFRQNLNLMAIIGQQGMNFTTEDLQRAILSGQLPYNLLPSPHVMANFATLANRGNESPRDRDKIIKDLALEYSGERTSPSRSANEETNGSNGTNGTKRSEENWSFEEQFKQLYEISDDSKRKAFLDDLFRFMQNRGSAINRLPIMAKQVLDLYELYNLVIARGGLVDVINKKLWQEIIKGLHLPSSITSAAFTLRTQYMKYLYPYECEKKKLSTPAELQAAIDGNKREGRRTSYGNYPEVSPFMPGLLVGGRPQMNGNGNAHSMHSNPNSPPHSGVTQQEQQAFHHLQRFSLMNMFSGLNPEALIPVPPQQEAMNLEVPSRSSEGSSTPRVPAHASNNSATPPRSINSTPERENGRKHGRERERDRDRHDNNNYGHNGHHSSQPAPKRMAIEEPQSPASKNLSLPGYNIKINSRADSRGSPDGTLEVSMEINGIVYQGVLSAHSIAPTMRAV